MRKVKRKGPYYICNFIVCIESYRLISSDVEAQAGNAVILIYKLPVISSSCLYINTDRTGLDNSGNISHKHPCGFQCVWILPHSAGAHSFQFWSVGRVLYYVNQSNKKQKQKTKKKLPEYKRTRRWFNDSASKSRDQDTNDPKVQGIRVVGSKCKKAKFVFCFPKKTYHVATFWISDGIF